MNNKASSEISTTKIEMCIEPSFKFVKNNDEVNNTI